MGCQINKSSAPINKEKMQAILLDINMAESYSTMVKDTLRGTSTKNPDSLATFYKTIFKHYGITREEFDKSMAWYKARPNEMDSLFSGIIPIATKLQAYNDSVQQASQK
jgi:hemoglobin-like flavoprotein